MKDYSKVTAMEYFAKLREVLNSLGRKSKYCYGVGCANCPLAKCGSDCGDLDHPEEMIKVIMEYEILVDWENIPVDTKILVRDREEDLWFPRYFAKYEDGKIYAFADGSDSFTGSFDDLIVWRYAKLYKGDESA